MRKTYIIITLLCIVSSIHAKATVYMASNSGAYSQNSTWQNGNIPPTNLNGADTVVIPTGITVYIDNHLTIQHPALIHLNTASLSDTNSKYYISIQNGTGIIADDSHIQADSIYISADSMQVPNATVQANKLTLDAAMIYGKVHLIVNSGMSFLDSKNRLCHIANADFEWTGDTTNTGIIFDGGYTDDSSQVSNISSKQYNVKYDYYHDHSIGKGFELRSNMLHNISIENHRAGYIDMDTNLTIPHDIYLAVSPQVWLFTRNHRLTFGEHCTISSSAFDVTFGPEQELVFRNKKNITSSFHFLSSVGSPVTVSKLEIDAHDTTIISWFSGHLFIKDSLILKHGILAQASLLKGAAIEGGSQSSYVHYLSAVVPANDSYFYPVGNFVNYAPVHITSHDNTDKTIHVGTYHVPESGILYLKNNSPHVNITWNVVERYQQSANIDIEFFWTANMEMNGFNRNATVLGRLPFNTNTQIWTRLPAQPATLHSNGLYSVSHKNVTLSDLVYGLFDTTTRYVSTPQNINRQNNTITLHPNPATDMLTVNYSSDQLVTAEVVDATGKLIKTIVLNKGNNHIDVTELASGAYFIKVTTEDSSHTYKFIKQ